jgi:NADH-quinone oxidoreductase subunit J
MEGKALYDRASRAPGRATFASFLLLWSLIYAISALRTHASDGAPKAIQTIPLTRTRDIPRAFTLQPMSERLAILAGAFRPTSWIYDSRGNEKLNVAGLGEALYTDHLVTVGLTGILLFVALVGAVAIANPKKTERAGS